MNDTPASVLIALGSNVGPRLLNLRRALEHLRRGVSVVRVSGIHETEAVQSPPGAGRFLNMVIAGHTRRDPRELLQFLLGVETLMGRRRPDVRNAPRTIDLDLILYGARLVREKGLEVPHPRYREREFVLVPLRELRLPWMDPVSGRPLWR